MGSRGASRKMANLKVSEVTGPSISLPLHSSKMDGCEGKAPRV